ncbi:LytTR family DNA-binding domain-containing protein [Alistipes sp.]|uniref:LytR/AlgR family response regulator transcription factor n=1 Tax=Alistipes sp. TaxID=1872444 RepID=UPI0025C28618|nr:LytTR family DNA-binding domain-containing protein [Alistipes sp.]MCI7139684.1 LytTR family DNA-binding domain-containing protein [Alistipes sp.]MDY5396649.1 LytTR family DNA-binding domain-containing protein [Alistipes sp.]
MNKLRVAIIEDEIPAARLLRSLIARLRPTWEIEVLPGSVEEAVQWFTANRHPDLLFLDIQLADGTSFELLSQARPSSAVIFTTAYDEYAVRAFSVNSIDYILKPVDEERLAEAIARYETLRERFLRPDNYLETLLDALQRREKRFRTRFLIAKADRFLTLPVEEIAYFYSENKMTTAMTFAGRNHIVDLPLSRLEEQLDPDLFFRANRQVLLSVGAIERIEPYFNGKVSVTVRPPHKEKITVSEERVSLFKAWLNY